MSNTKKETIKQLSVLELLRLNGSKIADAKHERELEIPRLSEEFGSSFIVKVRPLTMEKFKKIAEDAHGDNIEEAYMSCKEGLVEPTLNDDLYEALGLKVKNYKEALNALFLPGEIILIADAVGKLSGMKDGVVLEVKNS